MKKGKRNGIQRYQCLKCNKYQQEKYTKALLSEDTYSWVIKLNNEGCSISSISRLLKISKSSVQRIIERVALPLKMPIYSENNQVYEIDEMRTFCKQKKKECWVIYGINKATGAIIELVVGRRTKENVKRITNAILKLNPKRIYTDGLNMYKTLIPKTIHKVFKYCTNKIERNNLTLRTHLKRLSRKTICFTKNQEMLFNCLMIYII
jgi:insertion element IS1 protein InsB